MSATNNDPSHASIEEPSEADYPPADWAIPPWVRHPQLEDSLCARLVDLNWSHLQDIVRRSVTEDISIDFKRNWYAIDRKLAAEAIPGGDKKRLDAKVAKDSFELAKDVTSFANSSGGLVLIGVADSDGRATKLMPVGVTDVRRQLLLDVLRAWTTPYISGIEVGFIQAPSDLAPAGSTSTDVKTTEPAQQDPPASERRLADELTSKPTSNAARGCLAIYVPPSTAGPHAVVEPTTYRHTWHLRDGGHSVPIAEPQIAVLYRNRFTGRDQIATEARKVFSDGVEELDRRLTPFLAIAVAPSRKALRKTIDRTRLREFSDQTNRRQDELLGAHIGSHAAFGRGRVVLRDSAPDSAHAADHLLHLYADGRAFAAVGIQHPGDTRHLLHRSPQLPDTTACIRVDDITIWAIKLLGIAAGHSADAGATGDLEVHCGIIPAVEPVSNPFDTIQTEFLPHVVIDVPSEEGREHIVHGTRPRFRFTPVELTASPVIATDTRELLTLASQLVNEVVAEFGYLSNDPLLTADGLVVAKAGRGARIDGLRSWAAARGVLDGEQ